MGFVGLFYFVLFLTGSHVAKCWLQIVCVIKVCLKPSFTFHLPSARIVQADMVLRREWAQGLSPVTSQATSPAPDLEP